MNYTENELKSLLKQLYISENIQKIISEREDKEERNLPTVKNFLARRRNEIRKNKLPS